MSIEKYRTEIDAIDHQMMTLFKERMTVSLKIGQFKQENQLPVLDLSREKELLAQRKIELNDEQLWPYYETFMKKVMELSKAYQHGK